MLPFVGNTPQFGMPPPGQMGAYGPSVAQSQVPQQPPQQQGMMPPQGMPPQMPQQANPQAQQQFQQMLQALMSRPQPMSPPPQEQPIYEPPPPDQPRAMPPEVMQQRASIMAEQMKQRLLNERVGGLQSLTQGRQEDPIHSGPRGYDVMEYFRRAPDLYKMASWRQANAPVYDQEQMNTLRKRIFGGPEMHKVHPLTWLPRALEARESRQPIGARRYAYGGMVRRYY